MLMLLCAVATFAQAELPAEGAFFRLKNTTSQLYMTVNSYNSNNQNDGGVVISAKNTEDLSKQVFRLVKQDEKYHVLTFNNNVVSTFASWGFRAEESYSNAALTIEPSEGDIWTLKGIKGYIGPNNGSKSDGSIIYSNHGTSNNEIYWAFEAVTEDEATAAAADAAAIPLFTLSSLNNNSCYTITAGDAGRGSWHSGDNGLTSTVKQGVDKDATNASQQFAFIQKDDKYYLYSVAKKAFVAKNGNHTKYTKTAEDYVTFIERKSYVAPFVIALNGSSHMGISNGYDPAVITFYNDVNDGGNKVCIALAGEFNPAEALETFNTAATVMYEYQLNGKTLATQEAAAVKGEAYPELVVPALPLGVVVTGSKPAGAVEGNETVQITLGVDDSLLPFEAVAEGTPETWYYAQMHAFGGYQWFVAPTEDGTIKTQGHKFVAGETDAHLWGFVGTVEGGFKMVNKATEQAIKSNNSGVAAMASVEEATAFIAMGSKAGGKWFCLRYPNGDYLNSQSNVINHWYDNDNGSSFLLTEYVDEDVTVNVSEDGWATKYFGESVHVPAGVNAYIITGVENGWITKSQIAEGEVIPANTGVLLENAGEHSFAKTVSYNYTLAGNLLNGSVENTYVEGEAYVLANHEEAGVGFYKAELNKDKDGNEGATHFLNNAGKAYFVLPAASETVAFYGLDWDGTTGVENVVVENEVKAIYDLTGRRVEAITAPGIYIVNGKKVLVK